MEINIKQLKDLLGVSLAVGQNYNYQVKNSTNLVENKNLILNGYLCLNRKNYKLILIDESDWIYCEFLNIVTNGGGREGGEKNASSTLSISSLFKSVRIEHFNLVVESLQLTSTTSNSKTASIKNLYYIQTDLRCCHFETVDYETIDQLPVSIIQKQSILFTNQLIKFFDTDLSAKDDIINETIHEDESGQHSESTDHCYYFKVINVGSIQSQFDSQYKAKLRANIKVKIISESELSSPNRRKPINVSIALMRMFLYYYNFLHVGKYYLLRSSNRLCDIDSDEKKIVNPSIILFLEETMRIEDTFTPKCNLNEVFVDENTALKNEPNLQVELIQCLTGILTEKHLKNMAAYYDQTNDSLIDRFDLVLPNREFRYVVNLANADDKFVTIFHDSKFHLMELNILPGMKVNFFNLSRKSDGLYRSSSSLQVVYEQGIDILKLTQSPLATQEPVPKLKKSLHEKLMDLNTIYECFYRSEVRKISEEIGLFRTRLLFNQANQASDKNLCKILAQIVKIYDVTLRLTCVGCNHLKNSCVCKLATGEQSTTTPKTNRECNLEISLSMLVDDHTSMLKLNYTNLNFDLKSQKNSNLFAKIADQLYKFLADYLNQINLPTVPFASQTNSQDGYATYERKLYECFKEKINSGVEKTAQYGANNREVTYLNETNLDYSHGESSFFSVLKADIYKTLYDYLLYACIDKYFIFYVDLNDLNNIKEMQRLYNNNNSSSNNTNNPRINKSNYFYFRLDELNTNEQYKSMLSIKCDKFVPMEVELGEH